MPGRPSDDVLRNACRLLRWAGLATLAGYSPAGAEEGADPLRFVVRPSGVEDVETLDEKLARRERGIRFICIGCVRAPGAPPPNAPFFPLRVLGAPGLSQALAAPPPSGETVPMPEP